MAALAVLSYDAKTPKGKVFPSYSKIVIISRHQKIFTVVMNCVLSEKEARAEEFQAALSSIGFK